MVDTVWAVNAVTGAPSFSGKQARQTASAAFAGATAARPLGAITGVRPGTPSSTVTATSTTWTVQPFGGVADVESSAIAGPYQFAFDAVATGSVTAANATNPRVDIIYVQIDDPAETDGSTVPAATRKYLAGTAAPSPVAPTLPVTRAFVIANINVPVSGGGSPTVTWVAPFSAAAGGLVPVLTTALRDAATWQTNQQILLLADQSVQTYTGSRWLVDDTQAQTHTPTFNNFTLGNSTFDCSTQRHGLQRHYFGSVKLGSTSVLGTSPTLNLLDALPTKFGVAGSNYILGHVGMLSRGVAFYTGDVYSQASTTLVQLGTRGTNSVTGSISPSAPFTWKSTDEISWDFWAPIA